MSNYISGSIHGVILTGRHIKYREKHFQILWVGSRFYPFRAGCSGSIMYSHQCQSMSRQTYDKSNLQQNEDLEKIYVFPHKQDMVQSNRNGASVLKPVGWRMRM